MKALMFVFVFSLSAFADNLPGVTSESAVFGAVRIAQKFCAEDHRDPQSACEEWREKLASSVSGLIRSYCGELRDITIGTCRQSGSRAGIVDYK